MVRRMPVALPAADKAAFPPPPVCDDCRMPAKFRTEVPDILGGRRLRVYQCQNCARVIWAEAALDARVAG